MTSKESTRPGSVEADGYSVGRISPVPDTTLTALGCRPAMNPLNKFATNKNTKACSGMLLRPKVRRCRVVFPPVKITRIHGDNAGLIRATAKVGWHVPRHDDIATEHPASEQPTVSPPAAAHARARADHRRRS